MPIDLFSSTGASLLVLAVQALFAWALWSLRRAFVRQDDYLLHLQREARCEAATNRRLAGLENGLRAIPGTAALTGLHNELAALRGELQALSARMSGLDRLLTRLEHGLERQEDRLHSLPVLRQPYSGSAAGARR